jgi:hypothetical protein
MPGAVVDTRAATLPSTTRCAGPAGVMVTSMVACGRGVMTIGEQVQPDWSPVAALSAASNAGVVAIIARVAVPAGAGPGCGPHSLSSANQIPAQTLAPLGGSDADGGRRVCPGHRLPDDVRAPELQKRDPARLHCSPRGAPASRVVRSWGSLLRVRHRFLRQRRGGAADRRTEQSSPRQTRGASAHGT